MKKGIFLFSLLIVCGFYIQINAQSVGINNETPDASAILDVKSINKGMLIPRLTKVQRLTIPSPAEGLLVYDTDSKAFWYYQSGWKKISDTSKNVWLKEGTNNAVEAGDTSMYFMGNIGIGKDSAHAALDIENDGQTGLNIFQSFNNPENNSSSILRGAQIEVSGESNLEEIGIELKMTGNSPYTWAKRTNMSGDSLNLLQIGARNLVYGFYSPSDSIERLNQGVSNSLIGYGKTTQYGTINSLIGSSNGAQTCTYNSINVSGNGQQIGTHNVSTFAGGGELIGTYNQIESNKKGTHYGTKNKVNGAGELFGTYQEFGGSSDSTIYALYNDLDGIFTKGKKYGVYNNFEGNQNDSSQYAIYNSISGSMNNGTHYGISSSLDASGTGDRFGVETILSGSSSGKQYGIHNLIDNSGANTHYGVLSELEGTGTASQYGSFQSITNSGPGQHTGTQNTLGGAGTGIKIGTSNSMSATGNGTHYGTRNTMVGGGSGTHYGSHTTMGASGVGDKYADWNSIINNKNGMHYGEYTSLSGSGSGNHYGSSIELSGSGSGEHHGSDNYLTGVGSGVQIGSAQEIDNEGNATHVGVSNTISGIGSGSHFGMNNILIGTGSGNQYGSRNYISNSGPGIKTGTENALVNDSDATQYGTNNLVSSFGNGDYYGSRNVVNGTGTGLRVAGYFHASGIGIDNKYAAIFNAGHVVMNESSGSYNFRVESNNNQNMLFVDGSANRIGIGTNLPEEELDIVGTQQITRNSSATVPHLILEENDVDDWSRLTFRNSTTNTSNYWTLAGRVHETDASSSMSMVYKDYGNVLTAEGDGDVKIGERLGINTVNNEPAATLQVNSNAGDDALRIQTDNITKMRVYDDGHISLGGNYDSGSANDVFIVNQMGMGVIDPTFRFQIQNSATIGVGQARATAWTTYSDARVKNNIRNISYGLKEVLSLRPVAYDHHSSEFNENGLEVLDDHAQNIGFIAQEVYEIIEEVVQKPADEKSDLWSMDYEKLTPVLVKAIQELNDEKQTMQERLDSQQKMIDQLNKNQEVSNQELAEIKKAIGL